MGGISKVRRAHWLAVLAVTAAAFATSAGAALAQDQDGLVNVAIVDTQVAVPVSVAANVCDVNVGVLARQERLGGAACTADATSIATHNQGPGGGGGGAQQGGVAQDGLVNVAIVDTQIAVPVAVAANVCDVNVGILAQQLRIGETTCEADAQSMATHNQGPGGGARTL